VDIIAIVDMPQEEFENINNEILEEMSFIS